MKDAFGVDIQLGDEIIYATRRSSSQYMHRGIVTALCIKSHPWRIEQNVESLKVSVATSSMPHHKVPRNVRISAGGNCVVVKGTTKPVVETGTGGKTGAGEI